MRTMWVVCLLFIAGCTEPAAPAAPEEPAPEPTPEEPEEAVVEPWDAVLFLDQDGLSLQAPPEGSVPLEGFVVPAATGDLGSLVFESPAWPTVAHVPPQVVRLTILLSTQTAATGNGMFDLAAWFGTTRGESGFRFTATGPLVAGQKEVVLDFDLGSHPGIVLPRGEAFQIRVADSYEPEGAGAVHMLTGADATRIEFVVENLTTDPFLPPESDRTAFEGVVEGGKFMECDPAPDIHRFTVEKNASWVQVQLIGRGTAGHVDIDLDLLDGSTVVWHAGSPGAEEEILLAGPALAPWQGRELGVRTSICVGGQVDYTIDVAQG